jgi:hypothetical protein
MNWEAQPLSDQPLMEAARNNLLKRPIPNGKIFLKNQLILSKYGHLNVLVISCYTIQKQVDGPAASDAPLTWKIL